MLERRPCPVCGEAKGTKPWMQKESLAIVRCAGCGMKFVEDPAAIAPDYYETDADAFYTSDDKIRGDYSPHRYDREIRALRRHCPGGKILDVGCSTGGFLYQTGLRYGRDYQLFGTDVAPSATSVAKQNGVRIIETSFLNDDFPERDFQAITFWAVLEHLTAPAAFVRKAQELLAPGGVIFVVVPNVDSLALRVLGSRYRYVLPEHLNYFSMETLSRLFAPAFRPLRLTTSHFNPLVIAQDFRRRAAPKPSERAHLLNRTNAMKDSVLMKPLYGCYRAAEAVLARARLADNILAVFQKL